MKKILTAVLPALVLAVTPLAAHDHGRHADMNISIQDPDEDGLVTDCNDVKVTFAGEPAVRSEEMVPAGNISRLRINARTQTGVRINGWDQAGWSIKACKAAAEASALSAVKVSLSGDELTSRTSEDHSYVYFLIRAPKAALLDVDSSNGPIGLYDVNGKLTLRAQNGPISVKRSTGTIDATTVNGPISFAGGSGVVKLSAQNGPISLKIDGSSWSGSLDASTQNGPLSLKLPTDYRSGVIAEARGHGPLSCKAAGCSRATRTWDDDDDANRRIELGSGPTVIRVSTNNGPLSIKER